MIKGVEFDFGAKTLTVPPLSLGALERFQEKLAEPSGMTGTDIVDIALAALNRNYPALTREELAELVDVENCRRVIEAVMGVSAVVAKAGEARPAGRRQRRSTGA